MPVSAPDASRPRLIRDATFLEADRREIALRRGPHNRLGFAYQVAFVRVLGRFPQQAPLEIDGEILRFAALQLGADAETIHAYAGRQQTVSEHQQRIGDVPEFKAIIIHPGNWPANTRGCILPGVTVGAPLKEPYVSDSEDAMRRVIKRVGDHIDDGVQIVIDEQFQVDHG